MADGLTATELYTLKCFLLCDVTVTSVLKRFSTRIFHFLFVFLEKNERKKTHPAAMIWVWPPGCWPARRAPSAGHCRRCPQAHGLSRRK